MKIDHQKSPAQPEVNTPQLSAALEGAIDSAGLYARLIESARDIIFLLTPSGTIAFVSRGVEAYGYTAAELQGRHVSSVVHPEDVSLLLAEGHRSLADGSEFKDIHVRAVASDGVWRHMVVNGGSVDTDNGAHVYGIARDISDSADLRTLLASRNAALSAVNSIAVALSGSEPLTEILGQTLSRLANTIGLPSAGVCLLDEDGSIRVEAHHNLDEATDIATQHLRGELVARCAASGAWVEVRDVASDARFSAEDRELLDRVGVRAGVVVPLRYGESVPAVLAVLSPEPVTLSVEQMEFLGIAAGILGPAIANAKLHADLADRASVLAMLERLAKSINSGGDIPSILKACLSEVGALLECDSAEVALFDGDTMLRKFRFEASQGSIEETRVRLAPEQIAEMKTVTAPVALTVDSFDSAWLPGDSSTRSSETGIAAPLIAKGSSLGLFGVWTVRSDAFAAREIGILGSAAEHLAIAVGNARLYEAERVKSMQLETLAKEAHHRIKNNLQMISGLLTMYENDVPGQSISRCLRQVSAIATVHELLRPTADAALDLKTCLECVAHSALLACGRGEEIAIDVRGGTRELSAETATAVGIVVNELVVNAVNHGFGDRGFGSIGVQVETDEHLTAVVVRDDGRGLPEGFSLAEAFEGSSGLGLVHSLATHGLGGTVDMTARKDGVEVRITF